MRERYRRGGVVRSGLVAAGLLWTIGLVAARPVAGARADIDSDVDPDTEPIAGSVDTEPAARKGATLVPLPFYFYTPETESGFGALVAYYFRPDGSREDRPSSISTILVYTTRSQISALAQGEIYLDGGRSRLRAAAAGSEFPDTFWGVGNETPDALEEDYTPRALMLSAGLERDLGREWFLGPIARIWYREIVERSPGGLIATGGIPGTRDGWIVSGGVSASRDGRDDTVYPRGGTHLVAELTVADDVIGSDYDYVDASLAASAYVSPVGTHVLAMRVSARSTSATPPFDLLPGLGGDVLLRGYYAGRYRDRNMVAGQIEYRFPLFWRFGLVTFAAAGQVAHDVDGFTAGGFHASGGLGLRVLVSRAEGLNVRADFGSAETGSGFYLGIGEVF